jgi:hypothetical protein
VSEIKLIIKDTALVNSFEEQGFYLFCALAVLD